MNENEKLFVVDERAYGEKYRDHLFEQYKLYIESIEKTSDRRQYANNYFITINTAIISLIGLSFQINLFENLPGIRSILALIGIFICIIFWYLIRSYKQLNTGKFSVIHKIEERLPLTLYKYEWEVLGNGKDKNKYYPFSHIELWIPIILAVIYFILGVIFIYQG